MQRISRYPALNMAEKRMKTLLMSVFQKNQKSFWTLYQKESYGVGSRHQLNPWIYRNNVKALKYIDYDTGTLRMYGIRKLLTQEL